MKNKSLKHDPVLLQEVLALLDLHSGDVVVDGTLGLGGHAHAILPQIGPTGRYFGFDLDQANLSLAQERLKDFSPQVVFFNDNFAHCHQRLREIGISSVNAILLDLGLSSPHVDDVSRGFSFHADAPLDMRFNRSEGITAADVVNHYSYEDLRRIFYEYGEEPYAPKLSRLIVDQRAITPFKTTLELAQLVEPLMRSLSDRRRLLTRLFQALRIEVNQELARLKEALPSLLSLLAPSGRLAVMSYHSLEDRIVKQIFKEAVRDCFCPPQVLRCECATPLFRLLTKKPIIPSESEQHFNPRSRSAKLRVIQRLASS
ncbi:MAG: S-adenosyl-methyltransferase MraW [uncultured bacterium]|nr:MAG: S-adenosyl-methyltransferase MraW [uncultured bacterium]KKT76560.1 MAG: Ribosomal RNA small subunit methyltransferase H [Candidatus Peregrinibacteria bacterium GW2011_GWA2_44_7]